MAEYETPEIMAAAKKVHAAGYQSGMCIRLFNSWDGRCQVGQCQGGLLHVFAV